MPKYVYRKPHVRAAMALYDTLSGLTKHKKIKSIPPLKRGLALVLHQIGDVVIALPSLDALTTTFPEMAWIYVGNRMGAAVLKLHFPENQVREFDPNWQKVVRQLATNQTDTAGEFTQLLREVNPDLIVFFQPDLKINQLLGKFSGRAVTVGFANAGGGFHLTHPVDQPSAGHQSKRNYSLVETAAQAWQRDPAPLSTPRLTAPKTRTVPKPPYAILHPFASAETKNWLPENWKVVIDWLKTQKITPMVIGGPKDVARANWEVEVLTGQSLAETTALLQQAALFIGIDSGPGHLAAAVGTPIISIFSSVNPPERWQPQGDPKKTIILHVPVTDRKRFPYEARTLPAGIKENPYTAGISPEMVTQHAQQLLSR